LQISQINSGHRNFVPKVQAGEFAVVFLCRCIVCLCCCLARTLWGIKPDLAEFERVKAFLIDDLNFGFGQKTLARFW
jgi:hypothetical protein